MSIIYVLIPIAMLFVAVAVAVFFWAVKSEQFDDLDRQSVSILFDEDSPANVPTSAEPEQNSTAEIVSATTSSEKANIEKPLNKITPLD
ncbi:cbb3-type cytochrome oxidase assembly protein CcoS [Shewanella olleyana]|uniref:cbb3-type cytochrome oxidase assembly protein CcoS n=1 Tax=Shewanella olleyana TaxID=135626 RepID=UPI00200F4E16|nr:cbb3-type cytochrome oxidase assembly protein CcoS [Shewanella olleyana]MCL1065687.1 cbb3-type cytochrome oxidase assembly protein CcoS [Shewanella olleyana]